MYISQYIPVYFLAVLFLCLHPHTIFCSRRGDVGAGAVLVGVGRRGRRGRGEQEKGRGTRRKCKQPITRARHNISAYKPCRLLQIFRTTVSYHLSTDSRVTGLRSSPKFFQNARQRHLFSASQTTSQRCLPAKVAKIRLQYLVMANDDGAHCGAVSDSPCTSPRGDDSHRPCKHDYAFDHLQRGCDERERRLYNGARVACVGGEIRVCNKYIHTSLNIGSW